MIQLQFLNKLLRSKDASLLLVNNLNADFFSDYQKEFSFIQEHLNKYGNIPDTTTFLSSFPDFDIIEVKESTDYLLDKLYEDKNQRQLAATFNDVRQVLLSGDVNGAMKIFLDRAQEAGKATHLDAVDIFQDTSRYDSYVERTKDFSKFYVKTGFKELDDMIGGWDREEELATIIARTGTGKTWTLLKCAIAAAEQGLKVGIYSGEMSARKVGYRIDTLISHISNGGIMHGNVGVQNEYKVFIDSLPTMFKGSIKILTPDKIDGPAGVTALRAFVEKEGLDMLCIDQHSLLEDDRKAKDPVTKAANISKDLKNLQVLEHIPIIAVSQMNREKLENDVITTTSIAQSDRISQDSTIVIAFQKKKNEDNVLTLSMPKCRDNGGGRELRYAVDLDKGIFKYLPTENDGLNGQGCDELRSEYSYSPCEGDNVY